MEKIRLKKLAPALLESATTVGKFVSVGWGLATGQITITDLYSHKMQEEKSLDDKAQKLRDAHEIDKLQHKEKKLNRIKKSSSASKSKNRFKAKKLDKKEVKKDNKVQTNRLKQYQLKKDSKNHQQVKRTQNLNVRSIKF